MTFPITDPNTNSVLAAVRGKARYSFWAGIGHDGQTLDDLIAKMEELGNSILEVDETNQRILVAQWDGETHDTWGCLLCLNEGTVCVVDTEEELLGHCDVVHPGWRNR